MARKTAERRDALRDKLIEIAETRIEAEGLAALRARDLAREAGCALGAIYTVFDDLTGLILTVNGRTFGRLGLAVSTAVSTQRDAPPSDRLVTMAKAYLAFAAEHPNLWRALFDIEMRAGDPVPDWYLEELGRLFAIIGGPLRELRPEADPKEIDLMTRALFSSVHGIVLLGLEQRISAVPLDDIEGMIEFLVRRASQP